MSAVETMIRAGVTKGVQLLADFNRKRMDTDVPHPWLTGIHTPMTEEFTLAELTVTGTIPQALEGRYLRIGPNPIRPDAAGHHWFTGDGMVHGVAISGGRPLWYRNRWIRSRAVTTAMGEPEAPGTRHATGGDTVNTNVLGIGGRIWALVEAGAYPVEMSDTLEDQRHNPFDATLAGSFTAHPHRDPATGDYHAIAYDPHTPQTVRHVMLSPAGQVVRDLPIPVQHGPCVHDCAITGRYVVVLDLPVTFSMKAVIGGHHFPYAWNPKHPARVGLLPKSGNADETIWYDVDPCFVFHVANGHDLPDGRVILDVVAYDTMFAESLQGPDAVGRLERWTIDPAQRRVSRHVVDTTPQEFPRCDERRFGQDYRYAYTIGISPEGEFFGGASEIYKHDMAAGTRQVHDFGLGRAPGEFVFVPASADAREDEGWLIGLVIDQQAETTDLVFIDASDFASPPVAAIRIPHRIPPGFHGNWVAR